MIQAARITGAIVMAVLAVVLFEFSNTATEMIQRSVFFTGALIIVGQLISYVAGQFLPRDD